MRHPFPDRLRRGAPALGTLALLALAACQTPGLVAGAPQAEGDGVRVRLSAELRDPAPEARYAVQAVVSPYLASDVTAVDVKLYKLTPVSPAPSASPGAPSPVPSEGLVAGVTVLASQFSQPITFENLSRHTTYRARGTALKGTLPISDDAQSYVDIPVDEDDAPPMQALPIQLKTQVFSGNATTPLSGAFSIAPGVLASPSGPPTVTVL